MVYFGKLLPLQFSYLDWLVLKLRPIRKQPTLQSGLNSEYIKSEIIADIRSFVMLLQFLNYAQNLDFEIQYLEKTPYRVVNFRLQDFLQYPFANQNYFVFHRPHSNLSILK